MKRLRRGAWLTAALLVSIMPALVGSSSSSVEKVDVRVGGYAFEPGSSVALELVSATGAACFGAELWVEKVGLYDDNGSRIFEAGYSPQVAATEWLGTVVLRAADGSDLSPGAYEIRVDTSGGQFVLGFEVAASAALGALGQFVPAAPVCDRALEAYRLVTELDAGAVVSLRSGDRLMVLLSGNPTTGYSWSADQGLALRESREVEFRASSELLGAGGFFLFRYTAAGRGEQDFRFVYARPWESIQPLATLAFAVKVL